jgi:hypothetical protein
MLGFHHPFCKSDETLAMSEATLSELDFIEELRLRRWARENYVAPANRDRDWHPVILEEMGRKDSELLANQMN